MATPLSKDGLEPPIDSYKETVLPLNYSDLNYYRHSDSL